jgi:hypothetical protein
MTMLRNGKALAEAIAEFRRDKAPSAKKFGKYDYYKIEEYVELLDNCFGLDGYSVDYAEAGTLAVSPSQVVYNVKATVSVYGEDGSVVYRFSGYGTHEPTREAQKDENGNPINGTVTDRAINLEILGMVGCANALKSACTQLGCFGMRNLTEDGNASSYRSNYKGGCGQQGYGNRKGAASGQGGAQTTSDATDEEKVFYVESKATESGTDKNGNVVFILPCYEVTAEGKRNEKPSEIIFYHNFYEDPARLSKLTTQWNGMPKKLRFKVRKIAAAQQKNKDAYSAYTFRGFTDAR